MTQPKPQTVEHRWDILYREYPEVYDAFVSFPYDPRPVDIVQREFGLTDARVVDVGSGTGRSTFAIAEHAAQATGVEPEDAMLRVARDAARERRVRNVVFVKGVKEAIPLPDASMDFLTSFTGGLDVDEAVRVVRAGGVVISVDVAPGWYGGDLNAVLGHPTPDLERGSRYLIDERGFSFFDFDSVQQYGSVENLVRTYGFIHGQRAIDHVRKTGRTWIKWRWRIHYLRKPR